MAGGTVAVTGANGFLGSHVCDVLLAGGFAVRAAHRATSDLRWLKDKPLETVTVDLADPAGLDGLLAGCRGVIHCAGALVGDEATYQRVNVAGTRVLLEAAARSGTVETFVYVSSLAAGGPAGLDHPRDETMPDAPLTGYGRSKLAAEALLLAGDWPFRGASLRPPSLYGPRDREFRPLLRAAARGFTGRFGQTMQGLSLVHGRDAATAAVTLLRCAEATGAYYVDDGPGTVGPGDPGRRWACGYDWSELRDVLQMLFDRTVYELPIPLGLLRLASRLAGPDRRRSSPLLNPDRLADLATVGWVCRADRLRRDTGWTPAYDLASGFRETLDFYRHRGWL
jgi:nucleoside-diphosphate-sugar epimerase